MVRNESTESHKAGFGAKFPTWKIIEIWSAYTEGEIPVPIPNTVVKPLRADGSVLVRVCESRSVLLKIKGQYA